MIRVNLTTALNEGPAMLMDIAPTSPRVLRSRDIFVRVAIAVGMLAIGGFMSMFIFWFSLFGGMKGGDAPFFLVNLPAVSFVAIPLVYCASVLGVAFSYRRQEFMIAWASLPIFVSTVVYIALKTWWLDP